MYSIVKHGKAYEFRRGGELMVMFPEFSLGIFQDLCDRANRTLATEKRLKEAEGLLQLFSSQYTDACTPENIKKIRAFLVEK